jgi:predicted Rossmann fold nucleotide-binding protein DprA/Smf involved in DNA uptake
MKAHSLPALTIIASVDEDYPSPVKMRLGREAPGRLVLSGAESLLHQPLHAIFCSLQPPADLVLSAIDRAHQLITRPAPVIGGFQSPVEKLILKILLRDGHRIIICAARKLEGMRLKSEWSDAMREGRLLLISGVERRRRTDAMLAATRNRLVAALASEISIVHAAPGGRIYRVTEAAIQWGIPVSCPMHRENEGIVLLGARPWPPGH